MGQVLTSERAARARVDADVLTVSALVGVALLIRVVWLLSLQPAQITWDGAEYARAAENLLSGAGYIGIRGTTLWVFPPLYSLAIAAVTLLTHNSEVAGVAVSVVSGAAFVIPVYAGAKLLYGARAALFAGAIAAMLPFAVNISVVVLADAFFLTLATTGLYFALRTVRDASPRDAVLCGAAFGLAYLTRPEGLVLGGAAILTTIVAALVFRDRAKRYGVCVAAAALTLAVVAAPDVAVLSGHAGHLLRDRNRGRQHAGGPHPAARRRRPGAGRAHLRGAAR